MQAVFPGLEIFLPDCGECWFKSLSIFKLWKSELDYIDHDEGEEINAFQGLLLYGLHFVSVYFLEICFVNWLKEMPSDSITSFKLIFQQGRCGWLFVCVCVPFHKQIMFLPRDWVWISFSHLKKCPQNFSPVIYKMTFLLYYTKLADKTMHNFS